LQEHFHGVGSGALRSTDRRLGYNNHRW